MAQKSGSETPWRLDPVYVNARRETSVIIVTCFVLAAVAVGVGFSMGMGSVSETEAVDRAILGVPTWVFWSLMVPWIAGTLFTTWFSFRVLKDDPLGTDNLSEESSAASNVQRSGDAS